MQYIHKKLNAVYFDDVTLREMFEAPIKLEIAQKIKSSGISPVDFFGNEVATKEILDNLKMVKSKEDVEIFTSLYLLLNFYKNSKIGFILKDSFVLEKNPISSLEDLKKATKENDIIDVLVCGPNLDIRAFQLKVYTGSDNSEELFKNIKNILTKKYALDMGDVNLFLTLKCGGYIDNLKLENIHEKLKLIELKSPGHVLVYFNENNLNDVIVTLYPIFGATIIPRKSLIV